MATTWTGHGPSFELTWGGRPWQLDLSHQAPGLRAYSGHDGPLLGLEGLAARGRAAPGAFSGATLVRYEVRFNRVEATYAPLGWGAVWVKASWAVWGHAGVDLTVELQALSVGQLQAVELKLVSALSGAPAGSSTPAPRWVEPRDARAAALSYDGREADLKRLTTLPPRLAAFQSPRLVTSAEWPNWLYAEMIHPDDVTRRIREGGRTVGASHTTRYGLFGYDLEKGVVLRGRLRGLWLPATTAKLEAFEALRQFLDQPLPLTT